MPLAREDVVISSGTLMVRALSSVLGLLLLSVTRTLKENTLAADGVPLITPLFAVRVKPAGSAPSTIDHVRGKRPPVALN
jgi:hypothetical protein